MAGVVAGVDGSQEARTALRWAATVAATMGWPLRAVWAWQYPSDTVFGIGDIDLPPASRTDAFVAQQLQGMVDELLREMGGHAPPLHQEVARGPAATALLSSAKHASMLVVGSRGLGGFDGLRMGSVSRQVSEHAPCPVTIVRRVAPWPPTRLETIVVGTDGSPEAGRALTFAGDLAAGAGAELIVAHAADAPLDVADVEEWCVGLRDAGVDYRTTVAVGDPRTVLLEVGREHTADLVVVGSRGRGTFTQLLLGSVATSLAQHSELPVTVVPAHSPR